MKVVIIGGSGATGRELVLQLLADSRVGSIVVLVRKGFFLSHPKLREVIVDFDHLERYGQEIQGDIAFSTLGTTRKAAGGRQAQWRVDHDYQVKFAEIARANKMFTFVLLSAAQASEKSLFFYSRMERELSGLNFPKLIIIQPGPIDRPGSDRLGEKISLSIIRFLNRMGLLKEYQPITTIALAEVLIKKALADNAHPITQLGPKDVHACAQSSEAEIR